MSFRKIDFTNVPNVCFSYWQYFLIKPRMYCSRRALIYGVASHANALKISKSKTINSVHVLLKMSFLVFGKIKEIFRYTLNHYHINFKSVQIHTLKYKRNIKVKREVGIKIQFEEEEIE